MIKRLQLTNFRRHADTEITFGEEQKLIVISGLNGAGKSSIVEGITYAFFGEPRSGRAGRRRSSVDNLIRRGAEYEGMQVELDFSIADTEYTVVRRRDNKVSTAVLYGNGNPLVEGADQVTEEITRILGMNAAGFRLAVVAEQRELDGLASLQPAKRAAMLAKLLRLDAVTAARDKCRVMFNRERDIVNSMAGGDDMAALNALVLSAKLALDEAQSVRAVAAAAVVELDAKLAGMAGVQGEHVAARAELVRAETAELAAADEHRRLVAELEALVVPEAALTGGAELGELAERSGVLEREIARAEADRELAVARAAVAVELDSATQRLGLVTEQLGEAQSAVGVAEELSGKLAEAETRSAAVEARLVDARADVVRAEAAFEAATERLAVSSALGAVCDTCNQEIDEAHRDEQRSGAQVRLAECMAELGRTQLALENSLGESRDAVDLVVNLREAGERAGRESGDLGRLTGEAADLERRVATYTAQLERGSVVDVDVDELYAQRGRLSADISVAKQAAAAARARAEALEAQARLNQLVNGAEHRLVLAAERTKSCALSSELEERYAALEACVAARAEEETLGAFLATQEALAGERLSSAEALAGRGQALLERRRSHEQAGVVAANAAKLLEGASSTLSTRIRPALEGEVGRILAALSSGRYDAVQIDADYNVLVKDGETYLPLSEFSGGEIDLIALAMRLALAEVVGERHGVDALGLLILDECFGSQDRFRRESIRATLRNLREARGQIILISHVEGLEDVADLVIDVSIVDDEDGIKSAEVVLT
jgi:exonuclease SbcC